jgi:hypothetical protein
VPASMRSLSECKRRCLAAAGSSCAWLMSGSQNAFFLDAPRTVGPMPNPQREVELELAGLERRGFRRMVDHELAQSPSGAGDFLAAISG